MYLLKELYDLVIAHDERLWVVELAEVLVTRVLTFLREELETDLRRLNEDSSGVGLHRLGGGTVPSQNLNGALI